MLFEKTNLQGSGKEIIQKVLTAGNSQLLVPPIYNELDLEILPPPDDGNKYIGLFSSGTTGTPKCIWNELDRLILNAQWSANAFDVKPSDFCLMLAKPWHVAGFSWMLMAEYLDCEYLFITTYKGDYNLWVKTIQDTSPDYLFTVPQVLRGLYDEHWFVDYVVFGGASIKFGEYDQLSPHCKFMYQAYGQTEAGGLISCHKRKSTVIPEPNENLCHGKPLPGVNISFTGTMDFPAPIYIESPTAYQSTRYNSGDVGYFDKDQNLYLVNRDREKGGH